MRVLGLKMAMYPTRWLDGAGYASFGCSSVGRTLKTAVGLSSGKRGVQRSTGGTGGATCSWSGRGISMTGGRSGKFGAIRYRSTATGWSALGDD